jgi:hypothetical protein
MPESDTAPKLDDETTAALTLFNEYVEADRERTNREKRIKKAERAKDEAAAVVKKLNERGSAEEKAEAEAAYRVAADRWKKLRDGEEPDEPAAAAEATEAEEVPADAPEADEPAAETPAAEEPAAEEPAAEEAPSPAPGDDDEEEEPAEAVSDEEE